jgi:hypothetical protein
MSLEVTLRLVLSLLFIFCAWNVHAAQESSVRVIGSSLGWLGPHSSLPRFQIHNQNTCNALMPKTGCYICTDSSDARTVLEAVVDTWEEDYGRTLVLGDIIAAAQISNSEFVVEGSCALIYRGYDQWYDSDSKLISKSQRL